MKIRAGFVSNSSSSSFVVIFPDTYQPDTGNDTANEALRRLMRMKSISEDGLYDFFSEDENAQEIFDKEIEKYTLSEFETGPDEGTIRLLDNDKVRKILK